MLFTHLRRIGRNGLINFWRNPVISLASLMVMAVTVFIINSLLISSALLDATLVEIKDKVDINVYFTTTATEDEILALRGSLERLPEVSAIDYISREEALENFTRRHSSNALIIQSLQEIGDNPLGASLNIKAFDPSQYESIAKYFDNEALLAEVETGIVEKVNFNQNRAVIERLSEIISSTEALGFLIVLVFSLLAVIVTFNTVRLAIYAAREEITVMRLVGARDNYINGPFMISGTLYGLLAGLLVMILMYPLTSYMGGVTGNFFGTVNIFDYYLDNFLYLLAISLLSGAVLGAFSSFLAVRRYLKI